MNAELKALARAGGMGDEKLEGLIAIVGEDGAKDLLLRSMATQKSADAMLVAYKADELDAADDEYPAELLDALEAAYEVLGDWAPITDALLKLATPVAAVKPRVLTDSGRQSVLPTATKSPKPPTMKQWIEGGLNSLGDLH